MRNAKARAAVAAVVLGVSTQAFVVTPTVSPAAGLRAPRGSPGLFASSSWPEAYKAYVRAFGAELAVMSWKGYEEFGAGCVIARDPSGLDGVIYVPESKFVVSADGTQDMEGVGAILTRVRAYDPRRQFVVVFTNDGVMGADVVTPSIPPPRLAMMPEFADRHVTRTPTVSSSSKGRDDDATAPPPIDV
eukprot:CAMPEP_0185701010 /NCGR_PEP_ID=MMETSP1164-20130828/8254_1 /TAXON_ID=1104430 /ORGANISM="Chrysoreinhardia sp, Strain CCMP2950" /LENGTH=188 /DNA_ID=CAMNT_0028367985 /DNA_START=10 /DNA_END=576 /DNA_ORIENTATION=+